MPLFRPQHPGGQFLEVLFQVRKQVISPGSVASSFIRRQVKPFSMAEERRLDKGVQEYGHNWKAILRAFDFSRGRTAADLKDKWRNLSKKAVPSN